MDQREDMWALRGKEFDSYEACATYGCGRQGTYFLERGGVGSYYCPECLSKITANRASKGLQVRPLEWSSEFPEKPGLVAYRIGATNPFGGMGWGYRIDYPNDHSEFHATGQDLSVKCRTMEKAKSACEAHYQKRATAAILAALQTPHKAKTPT